MNESKTTKCLRNNYFMNKNENHFECLLGHSVLYSKVVFKYSNVDLEEKESPQEFKYWIFRMLKGYKY